MWELNYEEGWAPKNWCFWTVVLEKTLESPLDCKKIQPVHSEGDQSWNFFGRNDAKAETPLLWPPHVKSSLIGKDWCWEGLGAGGEGDDRGWDGWMALLTCWMRVWVNSGSWWWTGKPGVLQFMGSQGVRHDWATELNCDSSAHYSVSSSVHQGVIIFVAGTMKSWPILLLLVASPGVGPSNLSLKAFPLVCLVNGKCSFINPFLSHSWHLVVGLLLYKKNTKLWHFHISCYTISLLVTYKVTLPCHLFEDT